MLAGLENKCQMCSVLPLSSVSFQLSFVFVNFIWFPAVPLPALSAGRRSKRCWPIFTPRAAWLPCCAQGRLLVPKQDKQLCALIASQPLWHQLGSIGVRAGEKQQQLQPVVL